MIQVSKKYKHDFAKAAVLLMRVASFQQQEALLAQLDKNPQPNDMEVQYDNLGHGYYVH